MDVYSVYRYKSTWKKGQGRQERAKKRECPCLPDRQFPRYGSPKNYMEKHIRKEARQEQFDQTLVASEVCCAFWNFLRLLLCSTLQLGLTIPPTALSFCFCSNVPSQTRAAPKPSHLGSITWTCQIRLRVGACLQLGTELCGVGRCMSVCGMQER